MRSDEIRAGGVLAADAIGSVTTLAGGLHEAIAGRVFRALGPMGLPARVLHDGISRAVHAGVRQGIRALPRGGAELLALRTAPDAPTLGSTVRGGLALAAVNGYVGDVLAEMGSPLALGMAIRRRGEDVPVHGLAAAFPDATPRLAVFVHGLAETDDSWRLPPIGRGAGVRRTYGERLHDELGYTPLMLRYNTGRHISDNGRTLSALLEDVVRAWPVPVEEIALVGHSMGGLVARSACHCGEEEERGWIAHVRHVFTLGSPHLGADLEKGVSVLGWALARVPETRPLARLVNRRSVGIKDLRYGSIAEVDWQGHDPDEFLRDRCQEIPFLEGAAYYFIGATLSPAPVGRVLGDLLVRLPSASGRGREGCRSIPFEIDKGRHLEGLTHFDLLNHPAVYDQMRDWLSSQPSSALTASPSSCVTPARPSASSGEW